MDDRLASPVIDNTSRFLDAAEHLFRKLAGYKNPNLAKEDTDRAAASLVADLRSDIGPHAWRLLFERAWRNPNRSEN
jgi:hypothetical protein